MSLTFMVALLGARSSRGAPSRVLLSAVGLVGQAATGPGRSVGERPGRRASGLCAVAGRDVQRPGQAREQLEYFELAHPDDHGSVGLDLAEAMHVDQVVAL